MSSTDKKLFLLDAMALIYRAHFAFSKNPRINTKGLNTGAILGFTNSLVEIITKEKPSHIAVAFDTSAPTFRHKEFEAYKAQRQEQPEDIQMAIPYVKEVVKAFQIPVLELDGYEADDIIGTFAKQAARQGFTVYMMTPDKDYAQLVEEKIFLYKPAFMGNGVEVLGIPEVLAKFDIERVDQVTDILGLQGDAVDNIPGIPGIGAKTAIKLLKDYGTVENLVANVEDLKGKMKENVLNFGAQGIQSKQLATIHIAVPMEFDEKQLHYDGPDENKLKPLFEELEFRTLAKRILGEEIKTGKTEGTQYSLFDTPAELAVQADETIPQSSQPEMSAQIREYDSIHTRPHHYMAVDSPAKRKALIAHLEKQQQFCFDTETTDIQAIEADIVGISFSCLPGEAYYIPLPEAYGEAKSILEEFAPLFANPAIEKTGQNMKYDILILKKYGIEVAGKVFDTMLAHYLIDPEGRHGMDIMAETFLKYSPVKIESLIGKKGAKQGSMRDVDLESITEYAAEDADITLQLREKLEPEIKHKNLEKLLYEVEAPLIAVLADMEYAGVRIDTEALAQMSKELEKDSREVEKLIYDLAGEEFNIGSPKQLGEILFEKLKLEDKPKKTKTGQYATGEEILSKLAPEHKIARHILDFRELQKLKSTYVDALPNLISAKDGRVHTSYNQTVAATGRLSSTNPNLQNIPIRTEKGREIRKAFIPRDENHVLISADYSQIELRIMAAFSQDESMIEAFRNGRDIHATTASKIFKVPLEQVDSDMRRKAKTANFGIIYGISAFGLSQRLDIPRKEAAEIIDSYFREFPAVKKYMDEVINKARETEYVETLLGRKRYLRDINSRNMTMRGFAERNAINTPIQGSAADMIKIAMIQIHDWMKKANLRSKMILQVHDELIFDAHKDEVGILKAKVPEFMKTALELPVPMEIGLGLGQNWLEAH